MGHWNPGSDSLIPRLLVAGVGSRLSRDDAIGLELVATLDPPPWVECRLWEDADALTLAADLLDLDQTTLVVDCARMGLPPGSARCFAPTEAHLGSRLRALSSHGLGLAEALEIARRLGLAQQVHLFGVQPFDLDRGPGLSPPMTARLPALLGQLHQALEGLVQGPG